MWACYVVALVPVVVGALLWLWSRRITLGEWIRGSLAGFFVVAGYHVWVIATLTIDFEARSGVAERVTHVPECHVRDGDQSQFVPEHWTVTIDLGGDSESFAIPRTEFAALAARFEGESTSERPANFVPTDEDLRVAVVRNVSGTVVPGHTFRMVESGIRTVSDVLSFADPPDDLPLFAYPTGVRGLGLEPFLVADVAMSYTETGTIPLEMQSFDWRHSARLLGRAAEDFSIEAWDVLNAEVGRAVGANLIAIGFDGDSSLAHWQEAKWRGGKTNDLVVCYGPPKADGAPEWTYCFGWSDDALVRRNLETVFLRSPPGDASIPAITEEVVARYRPRRWPPLEVMRVRPPAGSVGTLLVVLLMIQGLYWSFAYLNGSRRAAADDIERAEVTEEERQRRERERDLAEQRRVRELLPDGVGEADIDALTELVIEDDEAYGACLALCRVEDPRAITALVIASASTRFRVREKAARWLDVHVEDPIASREAAAAAPSLMTRLWSFSPSVRREGRRVLEVIDPSWPERPDAAAETAEILSSAAERNPNHVWLDALAARGAAAVGPLLELLGRTETWSHGPLLQALGETGDLRGVGVLLGGLRSEDRDSRRGAADGFAKFGPRLATCADVDRVFEELDATLSGEDHRASSAAILGLGWLGDERAVDRLVPRLRHRSDAPEVIEALGHLGSPRGIEPISKRLADAEHKETIAIVTALGRIGDRRSVRWLIKLFAKRIDGGSLVLEHIIHALFPLGGPDVEAFLARAAEDPHSGVSDLAALRLRQLRADFVSPGWDPTAFALRSAPAR